MNEWETQAGIHDIYEQIFSLDGTAVCKQHIRLCPLARIDYALYTPAKIRISLLSVYPCISNHVCPMYS